MARKDEVLTTVTFPGDPILIGSHVFRTFSGGAVTAASLKSRQAAGQTEVERGGRVSISDITVGREDDDTLDLAYLSAHAGNITMHCIRQKLDEDNKPRGKSRVYRGKCLAVNIGDGDAQDTATLDDFTLTMGCDNVVS